VHAGSCGNNVAVHVEEERVFLGFKMSNTIALLEALLSTDNTARSQAEVSIKLRSEKSHIR